MRDDIPGHDVRDQHRNTEEFAKGVENAPNDAAQNGLETAGEASGMRPEGETFYLNAKDGTGSEDGTTYVATNGPDVFVYDFSQTDSANDSFEIYNFDSSEDTLIFTNADVPIEGEDATQVRDADVYIDEEIHPDDWYFTYKIFAFQPPRYQYTAARETNFNEEINAEDNIHLYKDDGGELADGPRYLDYPDDTTDPTPSETYAHVYQGDPLAVEGIA